MFNKNKFKKVIVLKRTFFLLNLGDENNVGATFLHSDGGPVNCVAG